MPTDILELIIANWNFTNNHWQLLSQNKSLPTDILQLNIANWPFRTNHCRLAAHKQSVTNIFFFDRIQIPNIFLFLEITEYQILNTIRYGENWNTKYRILFGIKKIQIPNTNITIRYNYLNTKYYSIYNILEKMKLK